MNYATLTAATKGTYGSIRSWANYNLIDVEGILTEAQASIYRRLRVREMRTSATLTLAHGAMTAAFPAGFLDPISMVSRASGIKPKLKTQDEIVNLRVYDQDAGEYTEGEPSYFAIFDELFQFDCIADEAKTYTLSFFKTPAALAEANATNFLTDRYPDLLRIACTRLAMSAIESWDRYKLYTAELEGIFRQIEIMDDLSNVGIDPSLEIRTYG